VRRLGFLVTVAVVVAVVMMVAGIGRAFADPLSDTPPDDKASCFGLLASSDATRGGPGQGISEIASNGGGQTASELVRTAQQTRPGCGPALELFGPTPTP
jgi:hypothetical protein